MSIYEFLSGYDWILSTILMWTYPYVIFGPVGLGAAILMFFTLRAFFTYNFTCVVFGAFYVSHLLVSHHRIFANSKQKSLLLLTLFSALTTFGVMTISGDIPPLTSAITLIVVHFIQARLRTGPT
tara:strand:- start:2170 stop:2544 length:375 start_codon:yes stop_codon:yes gene_type:complete